MADNSSWLRVLLAMLIALAASGDAPAAIIAVNSAVDQINNNGVCGLREAITAANSNVAVDSCPAGSAFVTDTITLQNGVIYTLTRTGNDDTAINGDLDITDDLILVGNGSTINANGATTQDRAFHVLPGNLVELRNLTVTGGRPAIQGGGILNLGVLTLSGVTVSNNTSAGSAGGGIAQQSGSLTLIDSSVTGNDAASLGGGLAIFVGNVTAVGSNFSNNSAGGSGGGGISLADGFSLSLTDVNVNGNQSDTDGGGILSAGNLTLLRTSVSGNSAGSVGGTTEVGGGIHTSGTLQMTDSTVSSNSADDSGGIINDGGTATLVGCTIRSNTAISVGGLRNTNAGLARLVNTTVSGNAATASAGGIANSAGATLDLSSTTIAFNIADSDGNNSGDGGGLFNNGTADVRNTLIGENIDASASGNIFPDCAGGFTSAGTNLIENPTGCTITGNTVGNITFQDPGLTALASNGGPTTTHSFPGGAPPHNSGNVGGCRDFAANVLARDQRGTGRAQPTRCDIGALELDDIPPTALAITRMDPSPTGAPSVRYLVAFSEAVTGVTAERFSLQVSGLTGTGISAIDPLDSNGDQYIVTIATGTGSGTLQLRLTAQSGIRDLALNSVQFTFTGALAYQIGADPLVFANGFE